MTANPGYMLGVGCRVDCTQTNSRGVAHDEGPRSPTCFLPLPDFDIAFAECQQPRRASRPLHGNARAYGTIKLNDCFSPPNNDVMPPRKRARASAQGATSPTTARDEDAMDVDTPAADTPATPGVKTEADLRNELWTDDQLASLFKGVIHCKPAGKFRSSTNGKRRLTIISRDARSFSQMYGIRVCW